MSSFFFTTADTYQGTPEKEIQRLNNSIDFLQRENRFLDKKLENTQKVRDFYQSQLYVAQDTIEEQQEVLENYKLLAEKQDALIQRLKAGGFSNE